MPTKTTSPSCNCRAAWQIINSFAVNADSVAIVDRLAIVSACLQPRDIRAHSFAVFRAIPHAVNPLVQIGIELVDVLRNLSPANVEIVVAIVIALNVRRMAAERLMDHGVHDETGNQRPVWVAANNTL